MQQVFMLWIFLTCVCMSMHAKELLLHAKDNVHYNNNNNNNNNYNHHQQQHQQQQNDEQNNVNNFMLRTTAKNNNARATTTTNFMNELEANVVSWTGAKILQPKRTSVENNNNLTTRRKTKSGLIIESNSVANVDINADVEDDNAAKKRPKMARQSPQLTTKRIGAGKKNPKEPHKSLNNKSKGALLPPPFNVASRATITANATCGQSGREEYCKLIDAYPNQQSTVATQCSICNSQSSDAEKQRPIESVIYNSNFVKQWWQSPPLAYGKQYEYVTIILDLKQIYQVSTVVLIAANSPRPASWILEKSIDGDNYQAWQYFGLNDADCLNRYNLSGQNGKYLFERDNEVICTTQFSKVEPPENGQIHVNLWKNRPGDSKQLTNELLDFVTARYIRLRFQGMYTTSNLGNSVDWLLDTQALEKRSFYSLQQIRVRARLNCHGHADQIVQLAKKSTEGQEIPTNESSLHCVCQHNTCGADCSQCCPLFNNKPFLNGNNSEANACEACQCQGHAESCIYDSYLGRGVCENCQNHTTGTECEFCESRFFRLADDPLTQACKPCDCDVRGSNGHCKPNTGECECLEGFEGERCLNCSTGYYGEDCRKCECDIRGTKPEIQCGGGDCQCKKFVEGDNCNRCLPGYYDLSIEHVDGCLPCWCSCLSVSCSSAQVQTLTFETLNDWKIRDIYGDFQDTPIVDEATKFPIYNTEDFSGTENLYWQAPLGYLGNRLTSFGSQLVVKVSWFTTRGDTSGKPTNVPDVILFSRNGLKIAYGQTDYSRVSSAKINVTFREEDWYHLPTSIMENKAPVSRAEFLSVLAALEGLFIRATYHTDQVEVALEHALLYSGGNELGGKSSTHVEQCVCPSGYTGLSCEGCEFGYLRVYDNSSILNGRCIPCPCNGHSNSCDIQSGGCGECMHNTYGERCERCKVGYYGNPLHGTANDCKRCACPLFIESNNFSPSCQLKTHASSFLDVLRNADYICTQCPTGYTGDHCEMCDDGYFGNPVEPGARCEPCNCDGGPCDVFTGECVVCNGNTEGWHCERCKLGFWGDPSMGCEPCDCYAQGSDSDVCDSTDGQCLCKPRFAGKKCDECDVGYAHIDRDCMSCNCDLYGALNASFCDPDNGQCQCKAGVIGLKCDACAEGYFGLKEESNGCEECKCSTIGATSNICQRNGQCNCLPNVTGRRCDKCKSGHWNLTQGVGCFDCRCDAYGARNQECNPWTGQCDCKIGVTGQHCKSCAEGFYGFSANGCQRCTHCTNEGQICDSISGRCICPHNSRGPGCTQCIPGSWGRQPRLGCRDCDCERIGSIGQHCDTNSGQCQCREGYDGRQCERCALGYFGFPECRRCHCHPDGSFVRTDGQIECDANGQCPCKALVVGLKCDTCMQATFGLSALNPEGCTRCFCFGRSLECEQSEWSWGHIRMVESRNLSVQYMRPQQISNSDFEYIVVVQMAGLRSYQREDAEFSLMNDLNLVPSSAGNVSIGSYVNFNHPLYFQLPPQFHGDRTSSYGGYLYYKLLTENAHTPLDRNILTRFPLVQIHAHKKLVLDFFEYTDEDEYSLNSSYKIPLHESYWKEHQNNQPADRALLMTALQNIRHIFLRGPPFADFTEVVLYNVHMDAAIFVNGSTNILAKGVERCKCPRRYDGLSCQDPGQGFYRWRNKTEIETTLIEELIGRAAPCQCNARSTDCHRETGICLNCVNSTGGEHCEHCAEGYYGDPNSSIGCQACPCPETSRNFAKGCSVYQGEVNCICKPGYTGKFCDQCHPGFYGNPLAYPNSTCQPCACNIYGIAADGCNITTGQCSCKPGITGVKCDQCQAQRHVLEQNGCKICDNCTLTLLDSVSLMADELENSLQNIDLTGVPAPYLKVTEYEESFNALNTHFYDFTEASKILRNYDTSALLKLDAHAENNKFQMRKALATSKKHGQEINNLRENAEALLNRVASLRADIAENIYELNNYGQSERHLAIPTVLEQLQDYWSTIKEHQQSLENIRSAVDCAWPLFYYAGNETDAAYDMHGKLEMLWRQMNNTNYRLSDMRLQLDRTLEMQNEFDDIHEHIKNIKIQLLDDFAKIHELSNAVHKELNHNLVAETETLLEMHKARQKELQSETENLKKLRHMLNDTLNEHNSLDVRKHWLPKAEKHAEHLVERFNDYARQFQPTRDSARIAMLASSAHKNISDAIEAAQQAYLEAREQVTKAHRTIYAEDSRFSVIQQAVDLLEQSKKLQNLAMEQVQRTDALKNVLLEQESKVDHVKSTLLQSGTRLNDISTQLHNILANSDNTNRLVMESKNIAMEVNNELKEILGKTSDLHENIKKLRERFTILEPDWEIKLSMADENISLIQTNIRLANVSLAFVEDQSEKDQIQFDAMNSTVADELQALRDKIAKARHAAESIKISLQSQAAKCVRSYLPRSYGLSTSNTIRLSFALPTRNGNSPLLYLQGIERKYIAIDLYKHHVRLLWYLGGNTAVIMHPLEVQTRDPKYDDAWYHIEVNRTLNIGSLLVRRMNQYGVLGPSSAVTGYSDAEHTRFLQTSLERIFLGGYAPEARNPELQLTPGLTVVVHNVEVDNAPVGIWNFLTSEGQCAGAKVGAQESSSASVARHFNGLGYAEVKKSRPRPYRKNLFSLQMTFNTLDENALLFLAVDNKNNRSVSVTLNHGRIMFRIDYGDESKLEINSTRKYNIGKWVKIEAAREFVPKRGTETGILRVNNAQQVSGSPTVPIKSHMLPDLSNPVYYLGGVPPGFVSATSKAPGADHPFLGCMMDVQVNGEAYDPLESSVYFGVEPSCKDIITKTGFSGNGYVELTSQSLRKRANVGFVFRTLQPDCLLLLSAYPPETQLDYDAKDIKGNYSISLMEGRIQVWLNSGQSFLKLNSNMTLNDGEFHVVQIIKHGRRFELMLDDELQDSKTLTGSPTLISMPHNAGGLYIGGAPNVSAYHELTPTMINLDGAIKDVVFNNRTINFNEALTFSNAQIGRNGPTMGSVNGLLDVLLKTEPMIGKSFTATPEGCMRVGSYSYEPNAFKYGDEAYSHSQLQLSLRRFWQRTYQITFDFRTFYPNGLIFLAPGHKDKIKHYVALMLKDGQLSFIIRGRRREELKLTAKLNDGEWHHVSISAQDRRITMSVLIGRTDQKTSVQMKVPKRIAVANQLLVGGLPEKLPKLPADLLMRLEPFKGCLRRLTINNTTQDLALPEKHLHVGQCFPNVERGSYFPGDAYAVYKRNFHVGKYLELELEFRTAELSGILLSISEPSGFPALSLELYNGNLLFSSDLGDGNTFRVISQLPNKYALCDNQWHNISALYDYEQIALRVDHLPTVMNVAREQSVGKIQTKSPLYIGGIPDIAPSGTLNSRENFKGCIRHVSIRNERRDWIDMDALHNVLLSECLISHVDA